MIIKIIGWLWLSTGIILVIMPGILRWQIQRKSRKIIKNYLFAIALLPASLLVAVGFRISGIIPKLIMVIGLIILVRIVFLFKSKVAEKAIDFLKKQPAIFFRLWALVQAAIGLVMAVFIGA